MMRALCITSNRLCVFELFQHKDIIIKYQGTNIVSQSGKNCIGIGFWMRPGPRRLQRLRTPQRNATGANKRKIGDETGKHDPRSTHVASLPSEQVLGVCADRGGGGGSAELVSL